jgi:arylsulfatase A-like enzyme
MVNVIVVFADDMRADLLPFMPKTLGLFSHRFTNCRVNGPKCEPARIGFVKGQNWDDHGWATRGMIPNGDVDTLGKWVSDANYHCAAFGKYVASLGGLAKPAQPGWHHWRVLDDGKDQAEFGFGVFDGVAHVAPPGRQIDYLTNELVAYLSNVTGPFFAWWCPTTPHVFTATGASTPKPAHVLKWSWVQWPVDVAEDVTTKPQWIRNLPPLTHESRLNIQRWVRNQIRELSALDDAIEAIFATLRARNLLDDTIVLFTSDNGVHFGEHRFGTVSAVFKNTLYDPSLRVPLLAHGPGFPPGTTTVPTTHQDITATVVAVTGATPTLGAQVGIDLREIVSSSATYADRVLLHQWSQANPYLVGTPGFDCVTTGPDHPTHPNRKFARLHVDAQGNGEREAYDLDVDPGEVRNWADEPGRRAERDELEAMLDALLTRD